MKKFPIVIAALILIGCAPPDPEELERLVKQDPSFKQVIGARDQVHRQVQVIRTDLLQKKQALDSTVDKLRTDYDAFAKAQNQQIEKYQASLEAYRALMKRELETLNAQLQAKKTEFAGYKNSIESIHKMRGQTQGIKLSKAEQEKWQERVLMLSEKARPLVEEIRELEAEIALKKRKLSYLT